MPRIAFDATTEVADEADRACSVLTGMVGEPPIGRTPPIPQGFLLVEDNGPWGSRSAAASPRLPEALRKAAIARKIRMALVRRHRPRRGDDRPRTLMVAWVSRDGGWLESTTAEDPVALAGTLDLDGLAAGRRPHVGALVPEPVVLVCTQGAVDPCCAKFGRPVAARLTEAYGSMVWEATHVGVCRFAANIVCLPTGVIYGQTTPDLALRQVEALRAGRIMPDGLRGHSGLAAAVQVAELEVRRRTDRWELDALTLIEHTSAAGGHHVTVAVGTRTYAVTLAGSAGTQRPKGCGDHDVLAPEVLHVVSVTERAHRAYQPQG